MIITHLGLIILTIIIYEFFKFLNIHKNITKILSILSKILQIIKKINKITDNTISKLLLIYSKILFYNSIKLMIFCFIIILLFFLIYNLNNEFFIFILSFISLLKIIFITIIYNLIRKKIYE